MPGSENSEMKQMVPVSVASQTSQGSWCSAEYSICPAYSGDTVESGKLDRGWDAWAKFEQGEGIPGPESGGNTTHDSVKLQDYRSIGSPEGMAGDTLGAAGEGADFVPATWGKRCF